MLEESTADALYVYVNGIGGHLCVVHTNCRANGHALKKAIEEVTGILAFEQRLFHGTQELTATSQLDRFDWEKDQNVLLVRRDPEIAQWLHEMQGYPESPMRLRYLSRCLPKAPEKVWADKEVVVAALSEVVAAYRAFGGQRCTPVIRSVGASGRQDSGHGSGE